MAVDVGNENTVHGQPSFRNTLSGGDRSALALSLFMSQLERANTPPDIAVLLDDPFQSQDSFRRTSTAFRIKECGSRCGQVVVLSHDPAFLKLVWDELPKDQRKALRLMPILGSTMIAEWDIYEHMKGELQANLETIQRYVDRGEGKDRDVAQKLRPLLEGYCRNVCIGEFSDGAMMSDMIDKVRSIGPSHPLHKSLAILRPRENPKTSHPWNAADVRVDSQADFRVFTWTEYILEELNSYARRYHHASNPDVAAEALSASELQSYCIRMRNLVRGKH